MTEKFKYLFLLLNLAFLVPYISGAQISNDTTACLIRFAQGSTTSYKIPLTKYCFVKGAGLKTEKELPRGWVMQWDVVKKNNSNLIFLEMNSTDVKGWLGNKNVRGSVQFVLEIPAFSDTFSIKELNYKTEGISVINNYGGIHAKKEYLNGKITLINNSDKVLISSFINLITESPDTKQQIIFDNKTIPSLTFEQYQEFGNKMDAAKKTETDVMSNALTEAILFRDSIRQIENQKFKDSLKLHPYQGKFRFWISKIDKPVYSRTTYCITNDSLFIKKGPYDFIYLAKNYSKDSVYFRKQLSQSEKELLSKIEKRVERDSLKELYHNFCIMDGLILSFSFESARFSKEVTVSNYYNETIAFVIGLVNKITPKKYQLWYDKKSLLELQTDCLK